MASREPRPGARPGRGLGRAEPEQGRREASLPRDCSEEGTHRGLRASGWQGRSLSQVPRRGGPDPGGRSHPRSDAASASSYPRSPRGGLGQGPRGGWGRGATPGPGTGAHRGVARGPRPRWPRRPRRAGQWRPRYKCKLVSVSGGKENKSLINVCCVVNDFVTTSAANGLCMRNNGLLAEREIA